jgi:hypothetical protein
MKEWVKDHESELFCIGIGFACGWIFGVVMYLMGLW